MALYSTCHTEGCPNKDVPIEVLTWTDEETGETVHAGRIECGGCGQEVTDITEATPEG